MLGKNGISQTKKKAKMTKKKTTIAFSSRFIFTKNKEKKIARDYEHEFEWVKCKNRDRTTTGFIPTILNPLTTKHRYILNALS
jgi:hypothetical protein